MQVKSKFELPWIEKYRPETLDDIIDHKEKINTLRSLISKNEMTHLIFYGPSGCGKCLGPGTPILMSDGTIKKVETITAVDQLMGDDHTPRQVLSICQGYDNMFKIIPSYGLVWSCNERHILCLTNIRTNQIVEISVHDYLQKSVDWRLIHFMYRSPKRAHKYEIYVPFTIEPMGEGKYYGFELDGNGRFLLEDYTVTHNTSMILACAREMYGDQLNRYILELNASDDRGIETVRKKIPDFVKTSSNKIRLVILDEVDAMTNDAQSALRRVIEKYSKNSRFCLICNNINKIIPGLQSRCAKMRFGYLQTDEINHKLLNIIEKEGVKITPPALNRLISLNKDFRQILNTLQCLHVIKLNDGDEYSPIEPDEINEYLGIPKDTDIKEIVDILFNQSFHNACVTVNDLFKNNQWNLSDVIHKLTEYIVADHGSSEKQKYFIIDRLSDIEFKLSHSNDAEVQLYTLVSAFQQSKLF